MSELYPLLLEPQFKVRPWGTRNLGPIYSHSVEGDPIGEVWLTGEECRVTNGPLAGATLAELSRRFGAELIGTAAPQPERFPLLIKFLFPREKLSVQVHPDDECARRAGLPCGKTECWYVLAAEPDAYVSLGVKPGTTRQDMERAIAEVRAEELLNRVEVAPGDLIYVDAGTVHAIGPGSILVETQQNSDTTYRLYDYGRGRELHVEQGLQAMKEKTKAEVIHPRADQMVLIESPFFCVNRYRLGEKESVSSDNAGERAWPSVEIVVGLHGCGVLEVEGCSDTLFREGQAVVVPAGVGRFAIRPLSGELETLAAHLPPLR
jgi:mannose-6-phosphate isomerase